MPKLEVFFDYACPYCLRGHEYLVELLPLFPAIEVEWRPCEAHPRPERYGLHSDLLARGMYVALEDGADVMKYHDLMYRAALQDRADIENLNTVAKIADSLLNVKRFHAALSGGAHLKALRENNRLAWEEYDFPAVPSYRMNGQLLKSVENVGVTKEMLADFLERN